MQPPPPLILPDSLHPTHAALLREHHFESAGTLGYVVRGDTYDGLRTLYAITNPQWTEIVYIGDSEQGRNLRGRLKAHLNTRDKAGHIERNSLVFVHVMVTEYMVLDRFEQEMKALPLLNRTKARKHAAWGLADVEPGERMNQSDPFPPPPLELCDGASDDPEREGG